MNENIEIILQAFDKALESFDDNMKADALMLVGEYTGIELEEHSRLHFLMIGFLMGVTAASRKQVEQQNTEEE